MYTPACDWFIGVGPRDPGDGREDMRSVLTVIASAGVAFAGTASADVISTFGFTDLNGSYAPINATMGTFTAVADSVGAIQTGGDVTRNAGPGGTAQFDTGFMSMATSADVQITLDVLKTGSTEGTGSGTLVITDVDGDTITATIDGLWQSPGFGVVFFSGLMEEVYFNDNGAADGTFNGISGSFDMDLPGNPPYLGAFSQLYIRFGGGFFGSAFTGQTVSADGQIVPAPGALALVGIAGLVSRRRRN
jgi:hypothetical protein